MHLPASLSAALILLAPGGTALAQNVETGRLLAQQWCLACHALSGARAGGRGPRSLESIANTENVNSEKIAAFLRLPHAVMPDLPLSRQQTEDIAAYIAQMRKSEIPAR